MNNPGWKRIKSDETIRVGYLKAHDDMVELPDGTIDSFAILEAPDAVTVVLTDEQGKICLNHEYAYPVDDRVHRMNDQGRDGWLYKFPGGGFNPAKETPEQAAAREIQEETGYLISNICSIAPVTNFFPRSNGIDYKMTATIAGITETNRELGEQNMRQVFLAAAEIDQLISMRDPRVMHSHFLDTWLLYKTKA